MLCKQICRFVDKYYKILEISPGASHAEIKDAYKKLVKKYHPDSSKMLDKNLATEKFKLIHEAKTVLLDQPESKSTPFAEKKEKKEENSETSEFYKNYDEFRDAKHWRYSKTSENFSKNNEKQKYSNEWVKKQEQERNAEYRSKSDDGFGNIAILCVFVVALTYLLVGESKRHLKQPVQTIRKPREVAVMGLKDPFTGKIVQPVHQYIEYLYKGQSGPHKRFVLLTENNDETSLFKCATCNTVISQPFLEKHALLKRTSIKSNTK